MLKGRGNCAFFCRETAGQSLARQSIHKSGGKEAEHMFKQLESVKLGRIAVLAITLFLLEIFFFDGGLIYSLGLSLGLVYVGKRKQEHSYGRIMFWGGLLFTFLIIINLMVVKLALLAAVGYLLYRAYLSKQKPEQIKVDLTKPDKAEKKHAEQLIKLNKGMAESLFGLAETPKQVYEWNNVNIQRCIGDTVIDLGNTILPKGEAYISVRWLLGNVKILVPYDAEVRVYHSLMAGRTDFFGEQSELIYNTSLAFQTEGYEEAVHKVTIITSVLIGDIEVRRI